MSRLAFAETECAINIWMGLGLHTPKLAVDFLDADKFFVAYRFLIGH